jgi:hypothetical protein
MGTLLPSQHGAAMAADCAGGDELVVHHMCFSVEHEAVALPSTGSDVPMAAYDPAEASAYAHVAAGVHAGRCPHTWDSCCQHTIPR